MTKKGLIPSVGQLIEGALQPAANEAGRKIAPLGKDIGAVTTRVGRVILAPLRGVVWGAERVISFIENRVSEKIQDLPAEKIVEPDPQVAGLAIQALQICGHKEELAEMFANLLASAVNSDLKAHVHPGFIDVIRQLNHIDATAFKYIFENSDEMPAIEIRFDIEDDHSYAIEVDHFNADIYKYISKYIKNDYSLYQMSIDNLERVGLIQALHDEQVNEDNKYAAFEKHKVVSVIRKKYKPRDIHFGQGLIRLTQFGRSFGSTCISRSDK